MLALGILLLLLGGDSVVKGASGLSQRLGLSPFAAGALLLAFATSIPELAVNAYATAHGIGDLALGNAIGSNVVNLGLTLGLAAVAAPLRARSRSTNTLAMPFAPDNSSWPTPLSSSTMRSASESETLGIAAPILPRVRACHHSLVPIDLLPRVAVLPADERARRWAGSGAMALTGRPDGQPLAAPAGVIDTVLSLEAAIARRSARVGRALPSAGNPSGS